MEHCPELNGSAQKQLEATISYKSWARLAPTLTHVVMHDPVTSGAKDERCHPGTDTVYTADPGTVTIHAPKKG